MTQLPTFEGEDVHGAALKISGTAACPRPLRVGARVTLIVDAVITAVRHIDKGGGIIREHTARVWDAYELPDGDELLAQAAAAAGQPVQTRFTDLDEED